MKFLTAITLVTFFLMGCGSPNLDDPATLDKILAEAMDWDSLQKRGKEGEELYYAPNQQTPFTGWAKTMYENGQVSSLKEIQNGIPKNLGAYWDSDGGRLSERTNTTFYDNGKKREELTFYLVEGRESFLVSAVIWKPNGDRCLETNVKNGNGVYVVYNEDGSVSMRCTYKNGEVDSIDGDKMVP